MGPMVSVSVRVFFASVIAGAMVSRVFRWPSRRSRLDAAVLGNAERRGTLGLHRQPETLTDEDHVLPQRVERAAVLRRNAHLRHFLLELPQLLCELFTGSPLFAPGLEIAQFLVDPVEAGIHHELHERR